MNTKDLGFFQQHTEKIALGLGVAVLVGVAATQFLLGEPNAVDLGNQSNVPPSEIKDTVVQQAQRLDASLQRDSYVDPIVVPRYARSFTDLYRRAVASGAALAPLDSSGLASKWNRVVSPDYPEKFVPSPPATFDVLAKSGHGVLADDGTDDFFRLQDIVGDQQPADFPYVSVRAKFPLAELKNRYEARDQPVENRIEDGLWIERLVITSVRLLRQKQDPQTGRWGEPELLDPMPGQYALPAQADPQLTFEEAQTLQNTIRDNQNLIQRVPFPAITNGPWTPPDISNRTYTPEEIARATELKRQIKNLNRTIARRTGQAPGGRPRPAVPQPEDDVFRDEPRRGRSNIERSRDRAAEQLQRDLDTLDGLTRELNELLGVENPEDPQGSRRDGFERGRDPLELEDFSRSRPRRTGSRPQPVAVQVPETVEVWAHDLTAEPGQTYRYKVVVSVLNPLFRFPRLNPDQLQRNRNLLSLAPDSVELDSAQWSAPLTLAPDYYFFLTGGSREQKRATFEVWTVYNGGWRVSEFTEYPGDEIGGPAEIESINNGGQPIPMNVGSIVLDVDTVTPPSGRGISVRALYLDPGSGQIRSRLVALDKNSTDRQNLRLEADRQAAERDQFSASN
ncbi:MAG: hypothetical protein AAGG38_08510 [Planctomycetota bacterium]